jgi:hypothetical protein
MRFVVVGVGSIPNPMTLYRKSLYHREKKGREVEIISVLANGI